MLYYNPKFFITFNLDGNALRYLKKKRAFPIKGVPISVIFILFFTMIMRNL